MWSFTNPKPIVKQIFYELTSGKKVFWSWHSKFSLHPCQSIRMHHSILKNVWELRFWFLDLESAHHYFGCNQIPVIFCKILFRCVWIVRFPSFRTTYGVNSMLKQTIEADPLPTIEGLTHQHDTVNWKFQGFTKIWHPSLKLYPSYGETFYHHLILRLDHGFEPG